MRRIAQGRDTATRDIRPLTVVFSIVPFFLFVLNVVELYVTEFYVTDVQLRYL